MEPMEPTEPRRHDGEPEEAREIEPGVEATASGEPGGRAKASALPAAIAAGQHVRVSLGQAARLRIEWQAGDLSIAGVPSLESVAEVDCDGRSGVIVWREGAEVIVRQQAGHTDGEVRLPVERAPAVVVSAGNGDIEARHIFGDLEVMLGHGDLSVTGGAGRLSTRLGSGDTSIADWQGPVHSASGTGDLEIERCSGSLHLEIGTGDLEVADCAGDAVVQAGTGDVQLRRHHGGRLRVRVNAGDIEVQEGELLAFRLATGSGDVESTAQLVGQPPAGSDRAGEAGEAMAEPNEDDALPPEGLYAIETGVGDVHLDVPAEAPVRVEVIAVRGEVDSDVPLVSVGRPGPRGAAQRLVGVQPPAADGERLEVRVKTLSGDVEIRARGSGRTRGRERAGTMARAMATRIADAVAASVVPPVAQALASAATAAVRAGAEVLGERAARVRPPEEHATERTEHSEPATARHEEELRAILTALAEGKISVVEAEALIDAL
jgi:DUF4097 and DUF4098 domain-containing protein YvlB